MNGLFASKFNDDLAIDDEIGAKSAVELDAVMEKRDRLLSFYLFADNFEFMSQARLVGGFQQSGAECSVYFDCSPDDVVTRIAHHKILTAKIAKVSAKNAKIPVSDSHFGKTVSSRALRIHLRALRLKALEGIYFTSATRTPNGPNRTFCSDN